MCGINAEEKACRASDEQYAYIDAIRIFAILMVIVLHCMCDFYNDIHNAGKFSWWVLGYVNEISRTGVPLFFMISGFLLIRSDSAKTPLKFYKKRLKKICIPFIVYDILYYCYYCIVEGREFSTLEFFRELANTGSAMHLWFMYSMILLYLFVPYLKIIIENSGFKALIFFLILAIFQTTIKPFINIVLNGQITLYMALDGIDGYMGYMVLGYILGTYKPSRKTELTVYILGGLSFLIFPIVNSIVASRTWYAVFNGGYAVNHYIEAAMLFLIFKNLSYSRNEKLLAGVARLCMTVYFIHVFALEGVTAIVRVLPLYWYFPILFVGTVVISFAAAYGIEYTKKYVRSICA